MDVLILLALIACVLIGFVIGTFYGISLKSERRNDLDEGSHHVYVPDRCEDPNVWREDLDDPEG